MSDTAQKQQASRKRSRSSVELNEKAWEFGQDWTTGDRILTWIVRHEGKAGELSALVEDGWSWVDVGKAMHLAGIAYRVDVPIDGVTLRKKAYQARSMVQARAKRRLTVSAFGAVSDARPETAAFSRAEPIETSAPVATERGDHGPAGHPIGDSDEMPRFLPVRWRKPPPPQTDPKPMYPPLPQPDVVDTETAIARMFGRPPPKKGG